MEKRRQYRGGLRFAERLGATRELRNSQTMAEEMLWTWLRDRGLAGLKFRRQHPFGPYVCDFYCAEAGLVVECDGPVHQGDRARQHDHRRDAFLRSSGLVVLRVPNEEVMNNTEGVLRQIREVAGVRVRTLTPGPSPRGRGEDT